MKHSFYQYHLSRLILTQSEYFCGSSVRKSTKKIDHGCNLCVTHLPLQSWQVHRLPITPYIQIILWDIGESLDL